jgi:hypothetical protein
VYHPAKGRLFGSWATSSPFRLMAKARAYRFSRGWFHLKVVPLRTSTTSKKRRSMFWKAPFPFSAVTRQSMPSPVLSCRFREERFTRSRIRVQKDAGRTRHRTPRPLRPARPRHGRERGKTLSITLCESEETMRAARRRPTGCSASRLPYATHRWAGRTSESVPYATPHPGLRVRSPRWPRRRTRPGVPTL